MPGYRKRYTTKKKPTYKRTGRKLQQRQVGPYRARGVGPIGALARGAAVAYRNRGAIREATNFIKRQFRRKPAARYGPSNAESTGMSGGGHTMSTTSRTIGRKYKPTAPRAMKLLQMSFANEIQHYQGVTNFDTSAGFFPLCNRAATYTGGELVKLPMNGIDLNSFLLNTSVKKNAHYAFEWIGTTGEAPIRAVPLAGQNPANDASALTWLKERAYTGSASGIEYGYYTDAVQHEWTSMKLLLYGARMRDTLFYVDFIRFKHSRANFFDPANEYFIEAHDAAEYLTGSLIYNPLMKRESKGSKHIEFVKRMKYNIPAETSLDLNVATGRLKQVNIFMRHGRILRYDRDESQTDGAPDFVADNVDLPHLQSDGADWQTQLHPNKTVSDRAHLYCIIRAFSPHRAVNTEVAWNGSTNVPQSYMTASVHSVIPTTSGTGLVNNEPTYDLVVRNKYSFVPKGDIRT